MTAVRKRVAEMFGERHSFWMLASFATWAVSFLKGATTQNNWSATASLVDYHEGFVKRGLFGALFSWPLELGTRSHALAFGAVVLLATFALLAVFAIQSKVTIKLDGWEVIALTGSSFAVAFVSSLIGYFDIVLFGMALAILMVRRSGLRLLLALPMTVAALLIHEGFLFLFLPLVLFSFAVQKDSSSFTRGIQVLVLGVVAVSTAVVVSRQPTLSEASIVALQARAQSKANFRIRAEYFDVFRCSASEDLSVMRKVFSDMDWQRQNFADALIYLPTLAIFWLLMRQLDPGMRWYLFGMGVAAGLSPLLLHLFGWDERRWNSWAVLTSFVALLIVCRAAAAPAIALSPAFRNAMLLVTLVSMAGGGMTISRASRTYPIFWTENGAGKNTSVQWDRLSQAPGLNQAR